MFIEILVDGRRQLDLVVSRFRLVRRLITFVVSGLSVVRFGIRIRRRLVATFTDQTLPMTVVATADFSNVNCCCSQRSPLRRAARKCLSVMRQKITINNKMLSVVSAGATAGVGGMERLRSGRVAARDLVATRERQVRLHALRTDFAVNLPPSITLPDGEDHPYSNTRLHIRDTEQEAEIYQKCIRPPPNRTVLESESPPPYRSSSAGLLGSSSSSSSSADWSASGGASNAPLVVRCHSMSSTSKRPETGIGGQKTDFLQRTVKIFTGKKTASQAPSPAPTLPAVIVPTSSRRRLPDQSAAALTSQRPSKGGV